MRIIREPRVRGTSAVGRRYQATTGEDTIHTGKDLVCDVVNFRMCKLAIALQLLVVKICKLSINSIINPNPIYSHPYK
jgi:hypothetical protein